MNKLKEQGFSLIEVLIAITLFAFFITAFLTSMGYNVSDSELSKEQLTLQLLAERQISMIVLDPPKFTNVTADLKETKPFEDEEYKGYEYTLEIKKIVLPDFNQLFSQQGEGPDDAATDDQSSYFDDNQKSGRNSTIEKMVFDEMKKNIERVIWQARVTVTNKETKYNFTLSTFITNYNEKIQLNINF